MSYEKILKKIDVHSLDFYDNPDKVCAIVQEHSFRGIVVNEIDLIRTRKIIGAASQSKVICAVDYTSGGLSVKARGEIIRSAISNGADEIEIGMQSSLFYENLPLVQIDIDKIGKLARDNKIDIKYKIDPGLPKTRPKIISDLCRMLNKSGIRFVTNGIFHDQKIDDCETVLFLRDVKKASACETKAYIKNPTVNSFVMLHKSGADVIGLDWRFATKIAYGIEQETLA